jgi:hypothetical protein
MNGLENFPVFKNKKSSWKQLESLVAPDLSGAT